MQISVIILNYNVRYFLEQCIISVEKALENLDGEIIVVDNHSEDDSSMMMRERFPNIKLIVNHDNLGFPKGNNIGVSQAKGEFICILNPDTVVAEDTFQKVLQFAKTKTDLGIVGCKLIDGTGRFLPECKRGIPTPLVAFTKVTNLYRLWPKSKILGGYYANHLDENQTGEVSILVGAFMVMKRELYLDLGGFDEDCFMYSDDIDLSYTALKKGLINYYFAETSIIHYKGESTVRDGLYMKRFREAMHFFYQKHFRVSFLFDSFMSVGAFLFSIFKKNQAVRINKRIHEYWLLSADQNAVVKVENLLGKKVRQIESSSEIDLNSLVNKTGRNVEIIFDNDSWSFKSIISFMERHNRDHFTFKILPKNSNFLIGSNSSYDRGEVIK
ncbi:MAG: glycosyltransferase family 2 protein [Bacteroidetes bacterium]|nr:glycosyltransferase family 2 protein [Bacteroidota bacterium]